MWEIEQKIIIFSYQNQHENAFRHQFICNLQITAKKRDRHYIGTDLALFTLQKQEALRLYQLHDHW